MGLKITPRIGNPDPHDDAYKVKGKMKKHRTKKQETKRRYEQGAMGPKSALGSYHAGGMVEKGY